MSTKVLVIGASGYIGEGVAVAFRRAGYKVYGVIRNENKRVELLRNEIIPVIADQTDYEKIKPYIERCQIIVDAIGFHEKTSQEFFEFFVSTVASNNSAVHIDNYKPLFIFTSGIMNYALPELAKQVVDETVLHTPKDFRETKERKIFEDLLLSNKTVRTVVVRPGFVYGKSGGAVPGALHFFDVDVHKPLELLDYLKGFKWSWVHVDDLGDAYVRIAKAGNIVDGQLFNLAANDNPTYDELKIAAAKAVGWKDGEIKYVSTEEKKFAKWAFNVIINPEKAFDLLGWRPRHIGVINEMEMYYTTWKLARIEGEALEEFKKGNTNTSHGAYFGVFM